MSYNGDTTGRTDIKINYENVCHAIRKLKNGKASGVGNIPNEFLQQGGEALIISLVDLFYKCKIFEAYPD